MFKKEKNTDLVHLYAIYDTVAEEFGPLYQAINDGVALRNYFNFMVNIDFKDDYQLHHIGYMTKDYVIKTQKYQLQIPPLLTQKLLDAVEEKQQVQMSKIGIKNNMEE